MANDNKNQSWQGDENEQAEVGRADGEKTKEERGEEFYSEISRRGGQQKNQEQTGGMEEEE